MSTDEWEYIDKFNQNYVLENKYTIIDYVIEAIKYKPGYAKLYLDSITWSVYLWAKEWTRDYHIYDKFDINLSLLSSKAVYWIKYEN